MERTKKCKYMGFEDCPAVCMSPCEGVCVGAHSPCVYLWRGGLCWGEMALRWCPTCLSAVFRRSCSSSRSRSARRDTLRAFLRECLSFPTRSFNCSFFLSSSATRSSSCPTRSSSSNNTFCTEEHSSWKIKWERWSFIYIIICMHWQPNPVELRSTYNMTSFPASVSLIISCWALPFFSGPYTCQRVCDGGSSKVTRCHAHGRHKLRQAVCVCTCGECVIAWPCRVYLSNGRPHVLPEQRKGLNPYCKEPNLSVTWSQRSPHELIAQKVKHKRHENEWRQMLWSSVIISQ